MRTLLFTATINLYCIGVLLVASNLGHAQETDLLDAVKRIEQQLQARVGVVVQIVGKPTRWLYREQERFPLSSTFKTLACAAVLHRVDHNLDQLERRIIFSATELVDYSPVTETRTGGSGMTLAELCAATLSVSDNTAGNVVLAAIGGPAGLTEFLRSIGDAHTRLDRWETELNEATPGDIRDTTTPLAMATTMEKLLLGNVLTEQSRNQLILWLRGNTVGDALLRAGIPESWTIADKTGAGGYGARSITAIMWTPAGHTISAAIYLTETEASFADRNSAIAQIGRAIANTFNE